MIRMIPLAALIAILCSPVVPGASAAGSSVPDSAQRAALERRIGRLGNVQLVGPTGGTLMLKPVVREDGLHMRGPWKPPRAALFVSGDVPAPSRPVDFVPWSAIEQVQVQRSGARTGFLAGAAFGAGVAAMLALGFQHEITNNWKADRAVVFVGIPALIGTGAATGMLLGSFSGGWHTVYPAPAPRGRP